LIKCIPLVEIPTVIEAVLSIVKVENPQDRDHSFTRGAPCLNLFEINADSDRICAEKTGTPMKQTTSVQECYRHAIQHGHGEVKNSFAAHREIGKWSGF
jgi:hypothetical protein